MLANMGNASVGVGVGVAVLVRSQAGISRMNRLYCKRIGRSHWSYEQVGVSDGSDEINDVPMLTHVPPTLNSAYGLIECSFFWSNHGVRVRVRV